MHAWHRYQGISIFSVSTLSGPAGLAYDAISGLLYVCEHKANRVAVMDPKSGRIARTIGCGQGSGIGQLNSPVGIALDGQGNLLVTDLKNNRVVVYNTHNGTPITSFPTLPSPYTVFVDAKGSVVVGGRGFVCVW